MKTISHFAQFSFSKTLWKVNEILLQTYCQVLRDKKQLKQQKELKAIKDYFHFSATSGLLFLQSQPLLPFCLALNKQVWQLPSVNPHVNLLQSENLFYSKLSHLILSIIFPTITVSLLGVMHKFTYSVILEFRWG